MASGSVGVKKDPYRLAVFCPACALNHQRPDGQKKKANDICVMASFCYCYFCPSSGRKKSNKGKEGKGGR
jgi:hypothetical protein